MKINWMLQLRAMSRAILHCFIMWYYIMKGYCGFNTLLSGGAFMWQWTGSLNDWPVTQIPQFTSPIFHNVPVCSRNVHICSFMWKIFNKIVENAHFDLFWPNSGPKRAWKYGPQEPFFGDTSASAHPQYVCKPSFMVPQWKKIAKK